MTCQCVTKPHLHRVVSLWIATLIVLVARVAFAQVMAASQSYAPGAVSTNASPPLFTSAVIYASGATNNTYSVAVADVNGDGKADIFVANGNQQNGSNGSVGVLLGNGNGTFQPAVTYDSGAAFADSVVVADVNGDGKPDIIVANTGTDNGDGSVGVLLGNGDGTFRAAATYDSGGQGAVSVVVADINLDGKRDILVANGCFGIGNCVSGSVGVLVGNGDGTFQPVLNYDDGGLLTTAVAVADVNGDGKPDMLVANLTPFSLEPNSVGVRLGNGDGTFQSEAFYVTGGTNGATSVAAADVNLDGKADLLVVNYFGGVSVLLGNGDGTFQPATTYASGGSNNGGPGLAVADVNGDGMADLLVANYAGYCAPDCGGALDVLLGNGDGTFQAVVSYSSAGYGVQSVVVADLNGDGKPDAVVANADFSAFGGPGTVAVLLNNTLDTAPPVITLFATAEVLRLPKRKIVRIEVSGTITDTGSGVNLNSSTFVVKDEDGKVQQTGAITLDAGGKYSFTVLLPVSPRHLHLGGLRYTVTVRGTDNAGNRGSKTRIVTVSHDRRGQDE
jgi:VCBS repeat protein